MKKIGVIAGAGPEAGIDLWKKLLDAQKQILGAEFRGDVDAPAVVVFSVPALGLAIDMNRYQVSLWDVMEREVSALAVHVDLICIACNVLHLFVDRLRALHLPVEIVSVTEVAARHLRYRGINKAGLLSISSVMELGALSPYAPLQKTATLVTPANHTVMDRLVSDIKRLGPDSGELGDTLEQQVRGLNVGHVLLACTELPLISRPIEGVEQIDVTRLLAYEVVRKSLADDRNRASHESK